MEFRLIRMERETEKVEVVAYFDKREDAQKFADFENQSADGEIYFFYVMKKI